MKCSKHPRYQAIRKPARSRNHPAGCTVCWKVFHAKERREHESLVDAYDRAACRSTT